MRTYIKPTIKKFEVKTQGFMAGSGNTASGFAEETNVVDDCIVVGANVTLTNAQLAAEIDATGKGGDCFWIKDENCQIGYFDDKQNKEKVWITYTTSTVDGKTLYSFKFTTCADGVSPSENYPPS